MKKIIITGGSGFIGQHVASLFLENGWNVAVYDFMPPKLGDFTRVNLLDDNLSGTLFEDADAIIHLAGTNIFGRWDERKKRSIYESRVLGTRNVVSVLKKLKHPPKHFISASAVGIYGDRGNEELDERALPGDDFLARVCTDWEKEAERARDIGIRTVEVRTAPVLGPGGLLRILLPVYRAGIGGPLGDGKQWFPWIHAQDIARVYAFVVENKEIQGPLNACSPEYVTNQEFSDALARILRRSAFFRAPKWAMRIVLNDLADSILVSQKVSPQKLIRAGYAFSFPNLKKALSQLLEKSKQQQNQ
jgi:uncharacterized protein (TIGR01777 family)